tara:strand:- start:2875 stop:4293 length:1419 start_codon:yes stop_codon:yes gene_type:complete
MFKNKIPDIGMSENDLFEDLENSNNLDIDWKSGKTFGAVYYPGESYSKAISSAYVKFMHENAFDPQLFNSILNMENELVQQTASLFSSNQKLFGNLTSGGTESIFLALLSARNWSTKHKNIKNPEVILSSSAHPAFLKAMNFLSIKAIIIPTNNDFNLNLKVFKEAINQNTILLVGSAPAYPTGMIDPISELSNLALENNLLLHIDACIGGFLLSYLKKCNYTIPLFDFNLQGVSSLSVDLHKYAYAPKGSSVLLYRNDELRKEQFSVYPSWEGGIYGSTSFLGTKPGGIVAATWFALNHIGENGYLVLTQKTMSATKVIYDFIQKSDNLSIIGNPIMSLLAFNSEKYDIFHVADELSNLGWYIGRLQNPRGIHLVVSQIHADGAAENFISDLQTVLNSLKKSKIKNKMVKSTDALAVNTLKKTGFNSIKKTILSKAKSTKKSKKRLIYDLKSDLNIEESDDLFRSILSNFY